MGSAPRKSLAFRGIIVSRFYFPYGVGAKPGGSFDVVSVGAGRTRIRGNSRSTDVADAAAVADARRPSLVLA